MEPEAASAADSLDGVPLSRGLPEGGAPEGGVPETPRVIAARLCTVVGGGAPDVDYPLGCFEVPAAELGLAPRTVALVAVTESDGRLVVAVPFATWHRVGARRVLPQRALQRAVVVDIPVIDRNSSTVLPYSVKVWLGLLAPEWEDAVIFEADQHRGDWDYLFDSAGAFILPAASSLAEAAEQQFAFNTAASAAPAPEAVHLPDSLLDRRLSELEKSVQAIAESLKSVVDTKDKPVIAAKPKVRACPPPPGLGPQDGIDYEVVRSAQQAGIPQHQIDMMLELAQKGRPKLTDLPTDKRKKVTAVDPLSESEADEADEDLEEEEAGVGGDSAALSTAVQKLTQIASHLVAQKKSERSLDSVLDGVGSGNTESSNVSGSRRSAAALRALRRALTHQPKEIYKLVESNMEADFNQAAQVPGSASVNVTARAWLEMRSRVQMYQTPVRLLWGIAGVWDCLRQSKYEEARARTALLMCQGDQLSIDRGNWILAAEMALEEPPPLSQFNHHSLPSDTEAPYTRLVDGRWVDLFLQKLADFDSLTEKKRKLNARRLPPNPPAATSKAAAKVEPKKKGKGKGKKSDDGGAAEADAEAGVELR